MIISIHIPKTAGSSFRELLKLEFGNRLMLDYGDWAGFDTAEAVAHRAVRASDMRKRRDQLLENYDVIHGHFIADKYAGLFPDTSFIAFFRDPFQQAMSNYFYLLRNPQIQHPAVQAFHKAKMTLDDYLNWDATRNPQTQLLGSVPINALAMVGLTEEFNRGLALFEATFGRRLPDQLFVNVNPDAHSSGYEIGADVQKIVETYRAADVALYRHAKEIFSRQAAAHGI